MSRNIIDDSIIGLDEGLRTSMMPSNLLSGNKPRVAADDIVDITKEIICR